MEKNLDFELLKELYPEEFKEYTRNLEEKIKFLEQEKKTYYKFYKLITEAARIVSGRDWFIETGSWLDVMDYMIEHPELWLLKYKKIVKKLEKNGVLIKREKYTENSIWRKENESCN